MKRIISIIAAVALIAVAAQAQNRNSQNDRNRQGTTTTQTSRQGNRQNTQSDTRQNPQNNKSTQTSKQGQNQQANVPQTQTSQRNGQNGQNNGGNKNGNQQNGGQMNNNPQNGGPDNGQQRIDNARQNMNDARQDYRDTKTQVKVDNRQAPTYQDPGKRESRQIEPKRPQVAPRHEWSRAERVARTNATKIVVYADFNTKDEAMDYVARLLEDRYYEIETYTSNTIRTAMEYVPTGFNSDMMFAMKFTFTRSAGRIRVAMTAQYRNSSLAGTLYNLIFQPDSGYATYYAWNVLEDIASALPGTRTVYER